MIFAVFSASDALVVVALISALAAVFGPVVVLLVSSLHGIRRAAEQAAHNTQSNGAPDTPPSAYDELVSSNEYMIGQLHAAVHEAHEASRAAWQLQAAIKQNDVKTDALAARVEEGFEEAKQARESLTAALGVTDAAALEQAELSAGFVQALVEGSVELLGRVDALDGGESQARLLRRVAQFRKPKGGPDDSGSEGDR